MVEGTSSRRQIAGFAPRSVTLRLTMVVPALVFSVLLFDLLVLATIFASCLGRNTLKATLHSAVSPRRLAAAISRKMMCAVWHDETRFSAVLAS